MLISTIKTANLYLTAFSQCELRIPNAMYYLHLHHYLLQNANWFNAISRRTVTRDQAQSLLGVCSRLYCGPVILLFTIKSWAAQDQPCMCVFASLTVALIARLSFRILAKQTISGLLIDTCNNIFLEGYDEFEVPNPGLDAPAGGDQTANVVITGDSSEITFKDTPIGPGAGTS